MTNLAKLYVKIYRWFTWATLDEACSDKPVNWFKRLCRKILPNDPPIKGEPSDD